MQIVIDIDEALYKYMQSRYKYQNKGDEGLSTAEEAGIAIKNGTVLPKGHGALIDVYDLAGKIHGVKSIAAVLEAPTIIPADTESGGEE